jgi:glucosylceramidase
MNLSLTSYAYIPKCLSFFVLLFFNTVLPSACKESDDREPPAEQQGKHPEENTGADVTIIVTTHDRVSDLRRTAQRFDPAANLSPFMIRLDSTVRYQVMEGFGAAITGSTCFNLLRMTAGDRARFLRETFDPAGGFGFGYVRISIGCSDFSLSEYTCCDRPGIENFALQDEELNYVIPVLKEILKINPELKILGSPWTCPRWMKVNNLNDRTPCESWTGGQLNPDYYADYAAYFVQWIQAFEAHGIHIRAVTPQNEPLNKGNSASLYMSWEEQRDFIKNALGPAFQTAGLTTDIYVFDHNYNYDNIASQQRYPIRIYEDDAAAAFVKGAAYHDYGGTRSELNFIHNLRPDKELIFTETSIGTWNDGHNLSSRLIGDMESIALGTINNWCKAVIVWNLMLDTDRGPNRDGGCKTCYGAVDVSRQDFKTITRNSHYYVIAHLSSVVRPGAVRIGAAGLREAGYVYAAFKNPDNSFALVLLNKNNESKKIAVSDGTHHFRYDVPPRSVASFLWMPGDSSNLLF